MISKELLSEVLGIKYSFKIEDYNESNLNNLEWWQNEIYKEQMHTINIYELAHKCKEWAFKQGFTIVDGFDELGQNICYIIRITGYTLDSYYEQALNYKNAFSACQWILENKVSK